MVFDSHSKPYPRVMHLKKTRKYGLCSCYFEENRFCNLGTRGFVDFCDSVSPMPVGTNLIEMWDLQMSGKQGMFP